MAAVEQFDQFKHDEAKQLEDLDVNLLCHKLEIVQQEQEAKARKRRKAREEAKERERHAAEQFRSTSPTRTKSNTQCWVSVLTEELDQYVLVDGRTWVNPKQLQAVRDACVSDHRAVQHPPRIDTSHADESRRRLDTIHSRSSSAGEVDRVRPKLPDRSKRRTVAFVRNNAVDDDDRERRFSPLSSPGSAIRSPTSPRFQRTGSSSRPSMAYEETQSPMEYVNEYTVSFDLDCDQHEQNPFDRSPKSKRSPPERPNRMSRSDCGTMMNLSSMLKKDRIQVTCEEDEGEERDAAPKLLLDPRKQAHARQKSSPDVLVAEAAKKIKKEDKDRRRKSVAGFFQSILMPSHQTITLNEVGVF